MTALYELRHKSGLTQTQLAEKIGVTPSCITMWESGNRKPDIITLKKLAYILNCTTDELLEPIKIEEEN